MQTVRFGPTYGTQLGPNIIGVNSYLDVDRTFRMVASKTQNITTHMQADSIYVDFGMITNAGKKCILCNGEVYYALSRSRLIL